MNAFLVIAVPVGFFALVGLSVFYLDARLRATFRWSSRRISRTAIALAIFGALAAIMAGATSINVLAGWAYLAGGYVFAGYLYLLLTVLGMHALKSVLRPDAPAAKWLVLLVPLGVTVFGAVRANDFVITANNIELEKLTHPVTAVLITDVHLGHHRGQDYLDRLVEQINQRKPDLILIAGDLVDANNALRPEVFQPLRSLAAPAFYVDGNHEREIDHARSLALIAAQGVRVLHNEVVRTHGLQLVGLDYMKGDNQALDLHPSADTRTIASVLPTLRLDPSLPTVLMHHSPMGVKYVAEAGVDLMVAGHTHGGQVFPATWMNNAFFQFNRGLYRLGSLQVFVSQGAGTFLQRVRVASDNEVNVLHLSPRPSQ